jgi:hypothetical protein
MKVLYFAFLFNSFLGGHFLCVHPRSTRCILRTPNGSHFVQYSVPWYLGPNRGCVMFPMLGLCPLHAGYALRSCAEVTITFSGNVVGYLRKSN